MLLCWRRCSRCKGWGDMNIGMDRRAKTTRTQNDDAMPRLQLLPRGTMTLSPAPTPSCVHCRVPRLRSPSAAAVPRLVGGPSAAANAGDCSYDARRRRTHRARCGHHRMVPAAARGGAAQRARLRAGRAHAFVVSQAAPWRAAAASARARRHLRGPALGAGGALGAAGGARPARARRCGPRRCVALRPKSAVRGHGRCSRLRR